MCVVATKVLIEIGQEKCVFVSMYVCDSASYMILLSHVIYVGSAPCSQ